MADIINMINSRQLWRSIRMLSSANKT